MCEDHCNRQYKEGCSTCQIDCCPDEANDCRNFVRKTQYIKLPCKVGDKIYQTSYACSNGIQYNPFNENGISTAEPCLKCCIHPCNIHKIIREQVIQSIRISSNSIEFECSQNIQFSLSQLGRNIFLTHEEAEQALKERKDDKFE